MNSSRSITDDAPRKLDTFLIPSTSLGSFGINHLHVAITDPVDPGNGILEILLVSISSIRPNHDQTCILKPADHPFITHDSYVVYRLAEIRELRSLERMLNNGLTIPKERAEAEVGERIIQGVEESSETKPYVLRFFRKAIG